MESNASITIPSSGRFFVALEPAVVDLIDMLGLDEESTAELVGLVVEVPPEARIAYMIGVYDDLAAAENEPGVDEF